MLRNEASVLMFERNYDICIDGFFYQANEKGGGGSEKHNFYKRMHRLFILFRYLGSNVLMGILVNTSKFWFQYFLGYFDP